MPNSSIARLAEAYGEARVGIFKLNMPPHSSSGALKI
jgi:hypothetical protein